MRIVICAVLLTAFSLNGMSSALYNAETFSNKEVKELSDRPLKVIQYAEDNLLELSIDGQDIKNILILNASGTIVGNIDKVNQRMAISTGSWPSGTYTMVYTIEDRSYREEVVIL